MAEDATQSGTSEGDSTGAGASDSGTSVDGGTGSTQAATDSGAAAFEAERVRLQGTIRTLQSERDSLRAAAKTTPEPATATAPTGLTMADLQRVEELREVRDDLKARFPDLPVETFRGYLAETSAEAFVARVEAQAQARESLLTELKSKADAEVRAAYAAKYGEIESLAPADAGKNKPPEGQATVESLLAKPLHELDPEEVNRVLRAV